MTSPRHALDTGDTGRYYLHPVTGQQLVSVTNVLSTAVAKPALVPWAAKITAEKALDLLPAFVHAALVAPCKPRRVADECGTCTDCLVKAAKREVNLVKEKASDLGTRIHHHADAHVTGAQLEHDEEVEPYLEQYLRFLTDFDIDLTRDVEAAELTVAHPKLGLAGTLDLLLHLRLDGRTNDGRVKALPEGQRALWVVDIKTSATKSATTVYPEMALQLTALRHCTEAWLPDDTVAPMPAPIKGAAVLNLRTNDYALIPLPSGTPEWTAYRGLLAGTQWLHGEHTKDVPRITPTGAPVAKGTTTRTKKSSTDGKAA
ncbi:hypothetical protein [Ornithinimicrobium cerasi]|uniref:hypothetical protein n=1 Tax=Ornithinimicrobium cerasi TaxID=2248773 RepID=UPI000F00F5B3|nr:hypothetical protein [Ornithinimicrobium cerasi]